MGVVTQKLWARQGLIKLPGGMELPFWGFSASANGKPQFPGPLIKARVGDVIKITLYNELNNFVSIVFPGQTFIPRPVQEDGVFVSYNTHATPGGTVNYTLEATRPGIFLYESGTSPEEQVSMGLYGAMAIYPREFDSLQDLDYRTAYGGNTGTEFDVEKILILGDIDSGLNNALGAGKSFNMLDFNPDYWVINGRAYPDTVLPDATGFLPSQPFSASVNATPGQRVLLRIINAGLQNHTFRLEGITARVSAVDSWPLLPGRRSVNATYLKNTVTIASGESYDLIFAAGNGGQHILHDRDLQHLCNTNHFPGGMTTRLYIKDWKPWTVPTPPFRFDCTVTCGNAIQLTWGDTSNSEDGFALERQSGEEDFRLTAVLDYPDLTAYTDYAVLPGTTYSYRIRAYNSLGFSNYSQICSTTTYDTPEEPTNLNCAAVSPKQVDLAWTDHTGGEGRYNIERKSGAGGIYSTIAKTGPGATFFSDTSVRGNSVYYYRVRLLLATGTVCYSNECTVSTPGNPLEPPYNLRAVIVTGRLVVLMWNHRSTGEDSFHIERKSGAGPFIEIGKTNNNQTMYVDSKVSNNSTYFYRVRAYSNEEGYSDYSEALLVNTP